MDGDRCTVIVGWSTAKDADVKKRWPNEPRARESAYMWCSSTSPDRLEKGGNEEHSWVFSSREEAIEYRDRLLKATGKEE